MRFTTASSPHLPPPVSVSVIMRRVLYALVPGIAVMTALFGGGVLLNILIACVFAALSEALMLILRRRPLGIFLGDYSAMVTALLLALALPPLLPWWLTALGVSFAIVFGKHLYGGLGYNPFNPAMVGYVVLLVSFPQQMTLWPTPLPYAAEPLGLLGSVTAIFSGELPAGRGWDAISTATPLDALKTGLSQALTVDEIKTSGGWGWINLTFLLGGLWLIYKRVIGWQIPLGMLGGLGVLALLFWAVDPDLHASPLFHLFSGAAMLGAFFIATDPVSAATTPRGRLYYGLGIGVIVYVIRSFGGYPDGVAFGVLLMNMAAPLIDHYTRPRVYGH
jgi:electron transport complex protein RnfD